MQEKYYDIEQEQIVTREQLFVEYKELIESGNIETVTFEQYINNCLTRNNGTLEIIKE